MVGGSVVVSGTEDGVIGDQSSTTGKTTAGAGAAATGKNDAASGDSAGDTTVTKVTAIRRNIAVAEELIGPVGDGDAAVEEHTAYATAECDNTTSGVEVETILRRKSRE